MDAMTAAQIRYDSREPNYRDLDRVIVRAEREIRWYDQDQRADWLARFDLDDDLDDDLIRRWAKAHRAGIQIDGRRLRTLYRRTHTYTVR